MSLLSQLPGKTTRSGKRLGRGYGSGKGAKSTRGTTRHQKGREHIPLSFEGGQNRLVKRFPLLRGKGKNKSIREDAQVVSLNKLNELFVEGDVVSSQTLVDRGVIDSLTVPVKVVATGDLTKKLTVQLPVSASAKTRIEAVGGNVVAP